MDSFIVSIFFAISGVIMVFNGVDDVKTAKHYIYFDKRNKVKDIIIGHISIVLGLLCSAMHIFILMYGG